LWWLLVGKEKKKKRNRAGTIANRGKFSSFPLLSFSEWVVAAAAGREKGYDRILI
jgi:hypothetical protein